MKSRIYAWYLLLVIISLDACTKSPADQRRQEKVCMLDSTFVTRKIGNSTIKIRSKYEYDNEHRRTRLKWYTNNDFSAHIEVTYAADGKIAILNAYDEQGNKKEDRLVTYDTQGRVAGYTVTAYAPHTTELEKVNFVYEPHRLLLIGFHQSDTLLKVIRYLENGNEVRAEYWNKGQLQTVDTTDYGTQLHKQQQNPDIFLVESGTIISKNLHTRRRTYNVVEQVYTVDDNYVFDLTPEGYIKKYSATTNFPISPVLTWDAEYFYKCE